MKLTDKDVEVFVCPVCKTVWDIKTAEKNDFICCHMEKKTLKEFNIPVVWQVCGTMKIQAYSLEEAEEMVLDDFSLPDESHYIDDSIKLDKESVHYGRYYDFSDGKYY